jgi:hypothetical protein
MTTRKTLKHFLELNYNTKSMISYDINSETSGPTDSVNEGDDLGFDPTTGEPLLKRNGLLGNYLKHIIDENTNFHKFKSGNQEHIATKRGQELYSAQDHGTETVYLDQDHHAYSTLSEYSNSGKMDDGGSAEYTISENIDKIGSTLNGTNNILSEVEGTNLSPTNNVHINSPTNPTIVQNLSYQLIKNNRFNANSSNTSFKPDNTDVVQFESGNSVRGSSTINSDDRVQGTFNMSNKFGIYEKDNPDGKIDLESLKSIGTSILLKAGGWDPSNNPGDSIDTRSDYLSSVAKGIYENNNISSLTDDLLVDNEKIRSRNASGAPVNSETGESLRKGRGDYASSISKNQSTFYNTELNFTGKNSNLIKLQAAAALLHLNTLLEEQLELLEGFAKIQSLDGNRANPDAFYQGAGPYAYGTNKTSGDNIIDFAKKNILISSRYPYSISFRAGMKVMFGINNNTEPGSDNIEASKLLSDEYSGLIKDSPGFIQSICFSIIRKHKSFLNNTNVTDSSPHNFINLIDSLRSGGLLNFMNAIATIGDKHLESTQGLIKGNNNKLPIDVDGYHDHLGTRHSKSRKSIGAYTKLERSDSIRSMPSMYMLPVQTIRANMKMASNFSGQNEVKGMLGSSLADKTFVSQELDSSYNKIPSSVVRKLEDKLEAQYVPFYIHDLRTNEIIAFDAFLTDCKDTFAPKFTTSRGYGRLDNVQNYDHTTRSVTCSFVMYASSKEDFDEMWFKINKLITLIYPQWTKGTTLTSQSGNRFTQPFSQVIGATPVVRLRVGDVIKSNYSKNAFARIHGIGDPDVIIKQSGLIGDIASAINSAQTDKAMTAIAAGEKARYFNVADDAFEKAALKAFFAVAGSPLQYIEDAKGIEGVGKIGSALIDAGSEVASEALVNGFVNPLIVGQIINQMKDPDSDGAIFAGNSGLGLGKFGYKKGANPYLKPNESTGYLIDGIVYRTSRKYKCKIERVIPAGKTVEKFINSPGNIPGSLSNISSKGIRNTTEDGKFKNFNPLKRSEFKNDRTRYVVSIIDLDAPKELRKNKFIAFHSDMQPNYSAIFNRRLAPVLAAGNPGDALVEGIKGVVKNVASKVGISGNAVDGLADAAGLDATYGKFMSKEHNPFTRAFETTMGRGLAGVLGNLSIDHYQGDGIGWETDYNSRGPKKVKIGFTLAAIHDLQPGLDHAGFNRAPVYNVGDIMKNISGDPHGNTETAEREFKKGEIFKNSYKKR